MTANRFALASKKVRSTAIGAQEFPEISGHYEVYAVPKIVINDSYEFTGAVPEAQFLESILTGVTSDDESAGRGGI